MGRFARPPAAALHGGVIAVAHGRCGDEQREHREDDQHDRDHIAHRIFEADRGDAQIGLRGEHVLHVEQQGGRKVIEDLDEDQARAGDIARHGQREDDAPEEPAAGTAEVLRGLLHRTVDIAQGCGQVDEDEREIVHALHKDHAVQPFHKRDVDAEPVTQQQVHRAVAPEEELHRDGTRKGRHDQRDHPERLDDRGTAKLEACREIGERQGEDRRPDHGYARDIE